MKWSLIRFGFNLTVRGGRESRSRLLAIAGGTALGFVLFLGTLSWLHALNASTSKNCWWECTTPSIPAPRSGPSPLVWRAQRDRYDSQTIKRLDVARTGVSAPKIPGVPMVPQAGQYYVSPALQKLLSDPDNKMLKDRYPGRQVGIIDSTDLSKPNELLIVIGRDLQSAQRLPGATYVHRITSQSSHPDISPLVRVGLILGITILLFPIAALIVAVSRISAARREERLAALRLVGATGRQVSVIASIETATGVALGIVAGTLISLLLRPWLASLQLLGGPFFVNDFHPSLLEYILLVVVMLGVATAVAMISLQRVRISPLGVSRRSVPSRPRKLGILVLLAGLVAFSLIMLYVRGQQSKGGITLPIVGCLIVIMSSLLLAGSWLTMKGALLLGRRARSASLLLAGRRLQDNPKAAFRTIAGLVLVLFSTTLLGCFVQIMSKGYVPQTGTQTRGLEHYMFVTLAEPTVISPRDASNISQAPKRQPLSAARGKQLMTALQRNPSVHAIPLYSGDASANGAKEAVVRCSDIQHLPAALAHCPGDKQLSYAQLSSLDIFFTTGGIVPLQSNWLNSRTAPPKTTENRGLSALLIRTNGTKAAVEGVRNTLSSPPQYTVQPLRTLSENQIDSKATFNTFVRIFYAGVGIMVFVAACNLVVSLAASLMERKRPFTLLRAAGTPLRVLRRVVLLEALLPLVCGTILAVSLALFMAYVFFTGIRMSYMPGFSLPDATFWAVLGGGLLAAVVIIVLSLPLLGHITKPDQARFE